MIRNSPHDAHICTGHAYMRVAGQADVPVAHPPPLSAAKQRLSRDMYQVREDCYVMASSFRPRPISAKAHIHARFVCGYIYGEHVLLWSAVISHHKTQQVVQVMAYTFVLSHASSQGGQHELPRIYPGRHRYGLRLRFLANLYRS